MGEVARRWTGARLLVGMAALAVLTLLLAWFVLTGTEQEHSRVADHQHSLCPPPVSNQLPSVDEVPVVEHSTEGETTLLVRVNAAGCEDGVALTLSHRAPDWEDGAFLDCSGSPLIHVWPAMRAGDEVTVTTQAEGFAEVRRTTKLSEGLHELELSLSRARTLRIQAIDHRNGLPLENAWGRWYGQSLTTSRVDATTWKGRKGIIEMPVPLGLPLLVSASGYAPRTWDEWKGMGPDEYEVLELEAVEEFYVHCTLDGEPCVADDEGLQVFSTWHRGLGAQQQKECEPGSVKGDYLCQGLRVGLEAQARLDRVVAGPVEESLPRVFGWDGQEVLGETVLHFPLVDPVPLELSAEGDDDPGTPLCVILASTDDGGCDAIIPSAVAGYGPSTLSVSSGVTVEWEADLDDEGILACDDGWAAITREMTGCTELELSSWGAVCVDSQRFNRCSLTGAEPPVFYEIEGCHVAVRPGRWTAHCRDESEGKLRFLDCGEVEVTGGETAEIVCGPP